MKIKQNSIILFLFLSSFVFSQERDFQTWTYFAVDKEVLKNTDVVLKHGLRFRENSATLYKSFTDAKIKYSYSKYNKYNLL